MIGPGAPEHLVRRYLRGGCFALAYEAARISGLPLMGIRDKRGDVHHAFVADPETGTAWDIRGPMPLARVRAGCAVRAGTISPISSRELSDLLGAPDPYVQDAAARAVRAHLLAVGLPVRPELRIPLQAPRIAWEPDPGTAELYTRGACHVFAIAALDLLAAEAEPLGFRAVTDLDEPFWEDEADPDGEVAAVAHVYAVLRAGGAELAVDVFGVRPLEEAVADCAARFGTRAPGVEDFRDLEELGRLIERDDDPESADRCPLWPVDQEAIESARTVLVQLSGTSPSDASLDLDEPSP